MKFNFAAVLVVVGGLLAPVAWAQAPIFVSVGQKKTVTVSMAVASVRASDPKAIKVKKQRSREVEIEGKEPGRSTVLMKTVGGGQVELEVHVVGEGATVYSTGRQ